MITFDDIEYFPIPEFKGYFISKCGKIFSAKTNRILKQQTTYKGYKSVQLLQTTRDILFLFIALFLRLLSENPLLKQDILIPIGRIIDLKTFVMVLPSKIPLINLNKTENFRNLTKSLR